MSLIRCLRAAVLLMLWVVMPATWGQAEEVEGVQKVAVITGSSSGLGAELTKLAMAEGMDLLLVDIRPEGSQQLAQQYRANGGRVEVLAVDLAKTESRAQVIAAAVEQFGRIDYLFNNAGYSYITSVADHDLAEAHRNFEVNYWAYVDLAQRAAPIMEQQGGGVIVNISSILGFTPASPQLAVYSANKHALVGFFLSAAPEFKQKGIAVKVVMPAGMRTDIFKNAVGKDLDRSQDPAAEWEHPSVVAGEIFAEMHNGRTAQFPSVAQKRAKSFVKMLRRMVR